MMPFAPLASLICRLLTFAILIRVILSWFPLDPEHPLARIIYQITEPILSPLRRVVPMVGMIDFTPLVAIIILQVVSGLLGG